VHGPGFPTTLLIDIWHLSWWVGGAQHCKEGVRGAATLLFFDNFWSIFGKKFLVFKDKIIGNTEFQKNVPYMTVRPNNFRPSRREVKNGVWKYLQIIVIGLHAVCGHLLDNQDRVLSRCMHENH